MATLFVRGFILTHFQAKCYTPTLQHPASEVGPQNSLPEHRSK
jgi:hypothetical protein